MTTILTNAWLDAFRRASAPQDLLERTRLPDRDAATLSDAIENALRAGGLDGGPAQPEAPETVEEAPPGRQASVDRWA